MAKDQGSENKTEKPTPKRRREAREEGEVAQSEEIGNVLVMTAALAAMLLFGRNIWRFLLGTAAGSLGELEGYELTVEGVEALVVEKFAEIGLTLAPLWIFIVVAGLAAGLAQTKMLLSTKAISPKLSAINPVSGFKNLFSLTSMVKILVSVVKLIAIGLIIFFLLRGRIHWLFGLMGRHPRGILDVAQQLYFILIVSVLAVMVVVAMLDYAYQKYKHEKDLMMTKQEVKDERKQTEGDPHVRGKQAQERRKIFKSRMAQAVPAADVVVANPTHYAVALNWEEEDMDAPKVVAKGKDLFAKRIKKLAEENDVPIVERKLLARTLYETVEVEDEIPPHLYHAVAEVLAFVMRKRN